MTTPVFDLEVEQGAKFDNTFNWYGGGKQMAPIEDIRIGYPTLLTVTAHGLPTVSDTPVIISGVEGATSLNSTDLRVEEVSYADANTFNVPVSTVNKPWVVGTGEITWFAPTNITGMTARCKIRKNWYSTDVIKELTTANGGLVLTVNDAGIQMIMTAVETAAFTFKYAMYDIELVEADGVTAHRVCKGTLTLTKESTT